MPANWLVLSHQQEQVHSRYTHGHLDIDFSVVREYDDVIAEAKAKKQQVHMARVHGFI